VVFPDPEGPIIAVTSPDFNVPVTPSSTILPECNFNPKFSKETSNGVVVSLDPSPTGTKWSSSELLEMLDVLKIDKTGSQSTTKITSGERQTTE
jgi:hypothetical protein